MFSLKRVTFGQDASVDADSKVAVDGGKVTLAPCEADFVNLDFAFDIPGDALIYGDTWERSYTDLCWKSPDLSIPAMPWYGCIVWERGTRFFGFGVETGANALAAWQLIDGGLRLILDVRSGSEASLRDEPLALCRIVTLNERTDSAFESMKRFCRAMCPNPLLPTEPVFGGNNWYYAYGVTDADCVMGDARRVAKYVQGLSVRPFMMTDVGWQPFLLNNDICSGGPYPHGNYRFPDLPGLAGAMKDIGVRPALWFRPLLCCESLPEHWYLKKNVLDPTVPEVEARIEADAARIASWGFDMIKHDFSTYDLIGMFGMHRKMQGIIEYPEAVIYHDRTQTTAQAIKRVYAAILRGAGERLVMSCNAMGHLTAGYSHIQRIGDDTSGLEWARTRDYGVNTLAFRLAQHNTFYFADPDCVGITNKIEWRRNAQWLDLVAKSGTPLFVATDSRAVTLEIEKEIIDAFRRAANPTEQVEPVDWMETRTPRVWRFDGEQVTYDWT